MKLAYILLVVLAIVIAGGFAYVLRPQEEPEFAVAPIVTPTPVDNTMKWPPEADVPFEPIEEIRRVTLKTNKGDITLALDGTRAPLAVGSFISLAEQNFYDGTTFHRVIPDFMIQGGDPKSKDPNARAEHGTGGPNYTFPDEINAQSYGLHETKLIDIVPPEQREQLPPELQEATVQQFYEVQGYKYTTKVESLPMKRSVVAMANSGPNTNGSQFFIITAAETPHLLGKHTPFGVVESGMEVVDAIAQVETDENDNPIEPVVIQDVVVHPTPLQTLE